MNHPESFMQMPLFMNLIRHVQIIASAGPGRQLSFSFFFRSPEPFCGARHMVFVQLSFFFQTDTIKQ